MKKELSLILFLFIAQIALGQTPVMGTRAYSDFSVAPGGFLNTFAPAPEEKTKNVYLYDYWQSANVYLKDSTSLKDLNIKIDLTENVLDILYKETVKILPFSKLLAISLPFGVGGEEIFINGETVVGKTHPFHDRLYRVLNKGEVSLYSTSHTEIVRSYTNQALAIDVEDRVEIKKDYFIIYKENIVPVGSKSSLKKELTVIFGDDVMPLFKRINPRQKDDLLVLVSRLQKLEAQK